MAAAAEPDSQRGQPTRRTLQPAKVQTRRGPTAHDRLELGHHTDREQDPGQPRTRLDDAERNAAVVTAGQYRQQPVYGEWLLRPWRPAESEQQDRQACDDARQNGQREQARN